MGIELVKIKAITKSKEGVWVNIISYDGSSVEWFYSSSKEIPDRVEIVTSQIKIEGKDRISGRLYFTNELNRNDNNMYYIDELAILDYSLFD